MRRRAAATSRAGGHADTVKCFVSKHLGAACPAGAGRHPQGLRCAVPSPDPAEERCTPTCRRTTLHSQFSEEATPPGATGMNLSECAAPPRTDRRCSAAGQFVVGLEGPVKGVVLALARRWGSAAGVPACTPCPARRGPTCRRPAEGSRTRKWLAVMAAASLLLSSASSSPLQAGDTGAGMGILQCVGWGMQLSVRHAGRGSARHACQWRMRTPSAVAPRTKCGGARSCLPGRAAQTCG